MLITLLVWAYISLLCWGWGCLTLKVISNISHEKITLPGFSFICLTGLIAITGIVSILSLFIPVGSLLVQLVILFPAVINFIVDKSYNYFRNGIKIITGFSILTKLLLACCLLMTLVISSSYITNLDTIGYHAQTIEWIEKFKAIPGLVHLHRRYGYQGLWYVADAFFNFSFLRNNLATFINTSVLLWFFLFIIKKINFYSSQEKPINKNYFFLWLGLLGLCLLSFDQVRLAATAPSPDFIAVIYTWSVFYLFLNKSFMPENSGRFFLVILFSIFALTIKLSVLPILLFPLTALGMFVRTKKIRAFSFSLIISLFLIFPFIARNIIASGYIVFPAATIDIVNTDWKYDRSLTFLEKKYITSYARTHVDYTKEKVEAVMKMSIGDWLPVWWRQQSISNQLILLLAAASTILFLFNIKKLIAERKAFLFPIFITVVGIVFWFVNAPDPRFGFGFIIPFIGLTILSFEKINFINIPFRKSLLRLSPLIFSVSIITYSGYWMIRDDSKNLLLLPKGLKEMPFKTIQINGNSFNIPDKELPCAGTPLPCVYDSCQTFTPRGKSITDGFKAKEGYNPTSWHL